MPRNHAHITNLFDHDKRYVMLSGGPGAGKSSILREIMEKGVPCVPEAARYVIAEWQRQNIPLPWENDPEGRRKDKNFDDDIANTQQAWLKDINDSISASKYGQYWPILRVMQNTATIQITEIVLEALQLWKLSAAGLAHQLSTNVIIKYAQHQILRLNEPSILTGESMIALQSVAIPVSAIPDRVKCHLSLRQEGYITGRDLANSIKVHSNQVGEIRFTKYKQLPLSRRHTIIMDRGMLDPAAFNPTFLQSIQNAMVPKSKADSRFSAPLREAAPDIVKAGYAVGQTLGTGVEHVIKALQEKGNVIFLEVEPLPRVLYVRDAQRHEDYDQAQEQHKNLLLAYSPFRRAHKFAHVPVHKAHGNPVVMTPCERAEYALAYIDTISPHYRLETMASLGKKH